MYIRTQTKFKMKLKIVSKVDATNTLQFKQHSVFNKYLMND